MATRCDRYMIIFHFGRDGCAVDFVFCEIQLNVTIRNSVASCDVSSYIVTKFDDVFYGLRKFGRHFNGQSYVKI